MKTKELKKPKFVDPLKGKKTTSGWKLTEAEKQEIIVRLANGEHGAKLAREFKVEQSSIIFLAKRRKIVLSEVAQDLTERKQRIIEKTLIRIEEKLDDIDNPYTLDKIRIDHLAKTLGEVWKQTQVESGKPTSIDQQNIVELKLSIDKKLLLIQGNTDIPLLEEDL